MIIDSTLAVTALVPCHLILISLLFIYLVRLLFLFLFPFLPSVCLSIVFSRKLQGREGVKYQKVECWINHFSLINEINYNGQYCCLIYSRHFLTIWHACTNYSIPTLVVFHSPQAVSRGRIESWTWKILRWIMAFYSGARPILNPHWSSRKSSVCGGGCFQSYANNTTPNATPLWSPLLTTLRTFSHRIILRDSN